MADRQTCTKCGIEKALAAYYSHPTCANGVNTKCKACCRLDMRKRKAPANSPSAEDRQIAAVARAPGEHVARYFDDPANCADCGVELTRNRRVVLNCETLCSPCRAARFGSIHAD